MAIPSRPKECAKITSVFGQFWILEHYSEYFSIRRSSSTFKTKLTVYLYRSIPQKNLYLVTKGSFATSKVESVIKIQA